MNVKATIYYRYEDQIDDGVLFIYNHENQKLIKSSYFVYQVLKQIDSKSSLDRVAKALMSEFEGYSYDEMKGLVSQVADYLITYSIIDK